MERAVGRILAAVAVLVCAACSAGSESVTEPAVAPERSAAADWQAVETVPSTAPAPPPPAPPPTPATAPPGSTTGGFTGVAADAYENSAVSCALYAAGELADEYGVPGASREEAAQAFAEDTYRSEYWNASQAGCLSTLG